MGDQVIVNWRWVASAANPRMSWRKCLYAFVCTKTNRVAYVGKAWGCTAVQRIFARDKVRVEERLEGVLPGPYRVLVGKLRFGNDRRNSPHNLADVERLLIYELQPPGNHASKKTGTYWDDLEVCCEGDWPLGHAEYAAA